MILTDLNELKGLLEIDPADRAEDKNLLFLSEYASGIIEEFLDRPGLSLRERTEYYAGTGTNLLCLRSRPVYASPAPSVRVDSQGFFGAASGSFGSDTALTYGTDYAVKIDQDDGLRGRSGILVKMTGYWERPRVRTPGLLTPYLGQGQGNIKVTYTGGYTADSLPLNFRLAASLLITKLRYIFPLGVELGGEGYEERSISVAAPQRGYLMSLVRPLLWGHRNWSF